MGAPGPDLGWEDRGGWPWIASAILPPATRACVINLGINLECAARQQLLLYARPKPYYGSYSTTSGQCVASPTGPPPESKGPVRKEKIMGSSSSRPTVATVRRPLVDCRGVFRIHRVHHSYTAGSSSPLELPCLQKQLISSPHLFVSVPRMNALPLPCLARLGEVCLTHMPCG
jgi:hypothetical protein